MQGESFGGGGSWGGGSATKAAGNVYLHDWGTPRAGTRQPTQVQPESTMGALIRAPNGLLRSVYAPP